MKHTASPRHTAIYLIVLFLALCTGFQITAIGQCCDDPEPAPAQCPAGYRWEGCGCVEVISPIIIDVTGHGFHLTSPSEGVLFDFSGYGHSVRVAWTKPGNDNGFLVLDRNRNGSIDNGLELFGNFTAQPPSATPNGFLALAEFDKVTSGGNANGVIDPGDAVYSSLRIWIDRNHNGRSDPGELLNIQEAGIAAISTDYTLSARMDRYGNQFRYGARVLPSDDNDSTVGPFAWDVFFTVESVSAQALGPVQNTTTGPRKYDYQIGHVFLLVRDLFTETL